MKISVPKVKLPSAVTTKFGRQILLTQKHSPVIMFGAGVVGMVGTVVLASKATLKVEAVLDEADQKKHDMIEAIETRPELYSGEDFAKDTALLRAKTVVGLTKLYAPAIITGVVSVGLLTGAHVVLTKRNVALTAAYAAVDKAFGQYRARVVGELGEDKDREFRYGKIDVEEVVQGKNGPKVTKHTQIDPATDTSMYVQIFDEFNSNYNVSPGANITFITQVQNWANDKLHARGHLFLNEVYRMLGLEEKPFGQLVGWVVGNGDSYVEFGLDSESGRRFMQGHDDAVWLDFNVDGSVWELIGNAKGDRA